MTRTRRLAATLALATLAAAAPALAADTPAADAPRGPHGWLQQRLGLTDEQASAVREIWTRQAEQRKQVRQALRQAHTDLRQLALDGGADEAIRAKIAEISQLTSQSLELRARALQEMAPLLTPEQRGKLMTLRPRRGRHHHGPAPQGS